VFGAFFGAHGAGHFLSDLGHPDFLFGGVVRERYRRVRGEFQVVRFPFVDAPGEGSVFAAEGAGGVGRGEEGVPDQHRVFGDGVGIDGLFRVRGRGVMEGKQGTGDLVGPAPGFGGVGGGVVVGDGLEFAEEVRIMQNSA